MKEHLINQIKEILGTLVEEVINVDSYLKNKSEQELKLIIRYIDARGEYTKNYFPYRFMNEDELIDMILRSLY